jgi:hypothetical protein
VSGTGPCAHISYRHAQEKAEAKGSQEEQAGPSNTATGNGNTGKIKTGQTVGQHNKITHHLQKQTTLKVRTPAAILEEIYKINRCVLWTLHLFIIPLSSLWA